MAEKAGYKHFMLKEIFEQPLGGEGNGPRPRLGRDRARSSCNEIDIPDDVLREIERVVILACGTSWHAALVGKFLIESLARMPVEVDYGSEYRYRDPIVSTNTLAIVITQSGETADTLAALREAKKKGARSIAICNVVGSMATRETDGTVYTHAGPEIGVASTKAFTSQLVALHLLALYLGQIRGTLTPEAARPHLEALTQLPLLIEQTLKCEPLTEEIAKRFYQRSDFLYLGRGINYPIALEGALKLKEISYIHAEGYPAGEMKHGPIALIDEQMPVVTIAPHDHVFEKMIGNIQEAKARGGSVIALTTEARNGHPRSARPGAGLPDHGAGFTSAAHAGPDGGAAAAARVPHRRPARLRRRSAAEPGQERDGGIEARTCTDDRRPQATWTRGLASAQTLSRSDGESAGRCRLPEQGRRDGRCHLAGPGSRPVRVREIGRTEPVADGMFDGPFDGARLGLEAECMSKEHRRGCNRADRVGHVLPGDIRRRPVHRLEQPRALAKTGGRKQTERSDDRASLVRQDVAEEVLGEDDVEGRRSKRNLHRAGVHIHVIERDVRIIARRPRSRPAARAVTFPARSPCPPTSRGRASIVRHRKRASRYA